MQFKVEFLKRERGVWQKTIYSVQRDDLCTSFFNPSELWYSVLKDVPKEQRVCPYKKGVSIFKLSLLCLNKCPSL